MTHSKTAKIILAPKAVELLRLKRAAREIPETDKARLDPIKRQIEIGAYRMDSREIAAEVIRNMLSIWSLTAVSG